MKVPPIQKLSGYNMSLYDEVLTIKTKDVEYVRKLYGDIGADIFKGKTPTILSQDEVKKSKKLINRIKAWWNGMDIFDYEQSDRLRDVILKYAYNKKTGKTKDIEKMFGQEGVRELNLMSRMGYIDM